MSTVPHKKDPRVPTMPMGVQAMAQKLREIIDAGVPQSPLAYAALSRLCVMWTPGALGHDPMGGGQFSDVVNDMLDVLNLLELQLQ